MEVWRKVSGIIWRSLFVGSIYTFLTMVLGALISGAHLSFLQLENFTVNRPSLFLFSVLLGFFMGAINGNLPASKLHHVILWSFILFFNLLGLTLEEILFAPKLLSLKSFPALILIHATTSLITSILVTFLFSDPNDNQLPSGTRPSRPFPSWSWRLVGGCFVYLLLYLIFGAIDYQWFPNSANPALNANLTAVEPQTILLAQLLRAPLVVISLLPLIVLARASKRFLAVIAGLTMSLVGGTLALLQSSICSNYLPGINPLTDLLQNFLTGAVIVWLLGFTPEADPDEVSDFELLLVILVNIFNRFKAFYLVTMAFFRGIGDAFQKIFSRKNKPRTPSRGGETERNEGDVI
jgi:hypothetical protein